MERKLAHIEQIHDIRPIEGADRIEQVKALGWNLIAKKGEFQEGDLCVYIEIDSKVPASDERFEFLESRDYKIKTMKMRGVISQGIALPLNLFPELKGCKVGDDVTDKLKITKIVTEEERRLAKEENRSVEGKVSRFRQRHIKFCKSKLGRKIMKNAFLRKVVASIWSGKPAPGFPNWIVKTDEERIQNLPHYCELTNKFYATEKIDGTSSTFAVEAKNKACTKYDFIVCSRNVRQSDDEQECYHQCGNVYWEMADKYKIKEVLTKIAKQNKWAHLVLQGETVGEGLQGNPYKFEGRKFFGYNFIVNGERWDSMKAAEFMEQYGITWVPILTDSYTMPKTVDEVLEYAEGDSVITTGNTRVKREGIVFRAVDDPKISFKAVSNSYLLRKKGK